MPDRNETQATEAVTLPPTVTPVVVTPSGLPFDPATGDESFDVSDTNSSSSLIGTPLAIGMLTGGIGLFLIMLIVSVLIFRRYHRKPRRNTESFPAEANLLNSHCGSSDDAYAESLTINPDIVVSDGTKRVSVQSKYSTSGRENPFSDEAGKDLKTTDGTQENADEDYSDALAIANTYRRELSDPFFNNAMVRSATKRSQDSAGSDILPH